MVKAITPDTTAAICPGWSDRLSWIMIAGGYVAVACGGDDVVVAVCSAPPAVSVVEAAVPEAVVRDDQVALEVVDVVEVAGLEKLETGKLVMADDGFVDILGVSVLAGEAVVSMNVEIDSVGIVEEVSPGVLRDGPPVLVTDVVAMLAVLEVVLVMVICGSEPPGTVHGMGV
ncbi:hypothetical protein SCAR479_13849 [Seiridium cardinale]|uniref:Uncharacterized protein n=1 Tax=Seiridium cardinale TaxID=138064 RepID=A0ABR2X6T0_9PEZI